MKKLCKKCNCHKQIVKCFSKNRTAPDGYDNWCKLCHQNYYIQHREKLLEKNKISSKKWNETHREHRKIKKREWEREARKNPFYRMKQQLSTSICKALKGKKGFRKWEALVGYTLQDLVCHIESLLNNNMTWENYGSVWHIDHITPKSWFKYKNTDDPQFKACWALANLQPKLKIDNIKKGNHFAG